MAQAVDFVSVSRGRGEGWAEDRDNAEREREGLCEEGCMVGEMGDGRHG